jgi:uncharacterized protein YutE (UPF0331/DUF86 family)
MKTENQLIGQFMGQEEDYDEHGVWQPFKYHSSWNAAIPVCRKLISNLLVLIDYLQKEEVINGDALHEAKRLKANLFHEIGCLDLQRVYKVIVEGIKWYNTQVKATQS